MDLRHSLHERGSEVTDLRSPVAFITIALDDGSGCFLVSTAVYSFSTKDVATAIGEASSLLVESFTRGTAERGSEWDPVVYRASADSILRSKKRTDASE